MDKLKKITLYALTAALLATSCPWQAFAERNQPVAPPPVTAPSGGESSEFGNKNGSDSNNNIVQNGKHRYNLDTIGLDKNGKKSLDNTPPAVDHQEYMAVIYNWSGLKMGSDGNAYDRKTGKLVYAPPEVKYDVVVSYKDAKTNQETVDVYSMFGFEGFKHYQDQYQGKQVNRKDMTSYHQPNYYDFSYKNYNIRNLLGKPIMGTIPKDAKFEIIEYSKPGVEGKTRIRRVDMQIAGFKDEQVRRAFDDRYAAEQKEHTKIWNFKKTFFKQAFSRAPETGVKFFKKEIPIPDKYRKNGSLITTHLNAADDGILGYLKVGKNT